MHCGQRLKGIVRKRSLEAAVQRLIGAISVVTHTFRIARRIDELICLIAIPYKAIDRFCVHFTALLRRRRFVAEVTNKEITGLCRVYFCNQLGVPLKAPEN